MKSCNLACYGGEHNQGNLKFELQQTLLVLNVSRGFWGPKYYLPILAKKIGGGSLQMGLENTFELVPAP